MTNIAEKTEIAKQQRKEKRAYLCEITAQARELKNTKMTHAKSEEELSYWGGKPLNFYITNYIYQNSTAPLIFKTFREWKSEGATVIKGSKAYIIWGQPLKNQKKDNEAKKINPKDETDKLDDFFPMCYVFSNEQVHYNDTMSEISAEVATEPNNPIINMDNYL